MTVATLIRKIFNRGISLTVSEVQSTIIIVENVAECRKTWSGEAAECPTSYTHQDVN